MKSVLAILVALSAIAAIVLCAPSAASNSSFLRIHIRADSNNATDQQVKYLVKQAVVDFLAPHLATVQSKEEAMHTIEGLLPQLKQVCDNVLLLQGKTYLSQVSLCRENFPDRTYDGVTLPAGVYDALIVRLGSGNGNNWWCVVYPPLCFVGQTDGTQNVVYKSLLKQIVEKWKANR